MTQSDQTPLVDDYDYHLPEQLIARTPLAKRSDSRLLHLTQHGYQDRQFTDLPSLLRAGDLLVLNDTKVMKARLYGQKATGGAVEVLVERLLFNVANAPYAALCHVRASRSPKIGQTLKLADNQLSATVIDRKENLFVLAFDVPILPALEQFGQMPIPPYFQRSATSLDDERYQSVFHNPNHTASVAAPTASLHFDDALLQQIKDKGVNIAFVTLNVGAGTFAPVKAAKLSEHIMHAEYAHLPAATAELINQTKAAGGRVIAVGTTVTRVLETAYLQRTCDTLHEFAGDTQIFIYPPYQFGVIDCLITNFHLPKSTLLMLVSAFMGTDTIKAAYAHAIKQEYRFFSYGDAMFLERATN
ncbi:tRNA preQ1(34) S-adenosylmethionine ribosyltransferase-isomerase QueA [Moraxella cuniculi]|uniref:S-adenosylmethionine:tRNA ribosyltransferase-isomerase n=1 Tax=Moraxella cuniculi TaxID=34061 RepID=A0A3S4UVB8_9GAMM|nr:tRNA preQ1(34) S-adenosylmethionine ribosyltransferase-isomerase QueA [Moraxella cuniculi]VEG13874.1 S-adenosylmethionine:tRNA ribosyltransferase-isomerase [Moraxella cuniculi]